MSKKYSRSLLRISVAQICQNLGWHSAQSSSLEVLTDVLERYLLQLGGTCHRYAEQFGRTQANLDDLGLAFRHMGINVSELEDYVRHVDPVPFAHEVVAFPAPKPAANLGFPNPRSREILQHREEHIPDHLPYIFPNMKDEIPEDKTMATVSKVDVSGTTEPTLEDSKNEDPSVGEKRSAGAIPAAEMPPSKRPRFGNSNLPEEAGHSQYEMTCVFMGPNGVLTTRQGVQGRQPEARMPPPNPRTLMESANKENSGKSAEPSVSTKMTLGVGGIGINGLSSSKHESKKSKKSLHKKSSLHDQVSKAPSDASKKSASSKAAAKFLKKLKTSKKSAKVFSKSKVKEPKIPDSTHREKTSLEPVKKLQEVFSSPPVEKVKKKKEKKSAALVVDSDEELRNLPSPTSSRRSSPERLIITDGEDNAKKKAILEAIDDSINSVLRDSPGKEEKDKIRKKKKKEKKGDESSGQIGDSTDGKSHDSKAKRKPGRPPKVTKTPELPPPIDIKPFVSEKYSSAELQVYEFKDSPPDASMKARRPSATETALSAVPPPPPPTQPHVPSVLAPTKHDHPPTLPSKPAIHRAPKKIEPEDQLFAPEIKFESRPEPSEALKDKLKQKVKDEKKVIEEKNKSKHKDEKGERHKKKKDVQKTIKERIREDKEKQKERDHKKEKREKKKEKEKKKKHKERDRDREKEKKKREDKIKQELPLSRESSPAIGLGVILKIKIGGSTGPSASMMVTGDSSSPAPSPASLTSSKRDSVSPHKIIPKLYISKSGPGPEEKPKKSTKITHGDKHKSSPITVATKSRSSSPSKTSPSPRSTPTPPAPRSTPTPPPLAKSNTNKEIQERKKQNTPIPVKERKSRSPIKGGRKEKKKERKESLSSLSPDSSSSSPSSPKSSIVPRRQTPPKLQRVSSSSSPEKSPPSLPFQSPTPSPKTISRATRSPSHTSSPHRSPSSPPSLSRRKPTPPPSLSPATVRHPRKRSPSPSPTKPPTPGSTSPAQSPEWNLPLSPAHHRSPTPTPRTPTASPSRNIPSPSHSSPPGSPGSPGRSPSPADQPASRPGSRAVETPEPKYLKDNPSPASSGKSSTSTFKPARTVEAETVCVFIDEAGQKVWICPGCKLPDDGTEMIGCDMCDNWYHWPCVGITEAPPESQDWFCKKCLPKSKSRGRGRPRGRGRGRGKKKIM